MFRKQDTRELAFWNLVPEHEMAVAPHRWGPNEKLVVPFKDSTEERMQYGDIWRLGRAARRSPMPPSDAPTPRTYVYAQCDALTCAKHAAQGGWLVLGV